MIHTAISPEVRFPAVSEGRGRVWIVWRGIEVPSPARLDVLRGAHRIEVRDRWRDSEGVCLQLYHPHDPDRFMDYYVKAVLTIEGAGFLALRMADGWPSDDESCEQAYNLCVVKVLEPLMLQMCDENEFASVRLKFESSIAERESESTTIKEIESVLGAIPSIDGSIRNKQRRRFREAQGSPYPVCCIVCTQEAGNGHYCVTCGVYRGAPDCPHCKKPVSDQLDERLRFHDENGWYPWHYGWLGRCESCGYRFNSRGELRTGHTIAFNDDASQRILEAIENNQAGDDGFFDGRSTVSIEMGESVQSYCDAWDYRPTIVISIKRESSANRVDHLDPTDGSLKPEEKIVLTPLEWHYIKEQLEGPLGVLLERKPWSRDTT